MNIRLESIYFALQELYSVLNNWRQLSDLEDLTKAEEKAKKSLTTAFDNNLDFFDSFLQDLQIFQGMFIVQWPQK